MTPVEYYAELSSFNKSVEITRLKSQLKRTSFVAGLLAIMLGALLIGSTYVVMPYVCSY